MRQRALIVTLACIFLTAILLIIKHTQREDVLLQIVDIKDGTAYGDAGRQMVGKTLNTTRIEYGDLAKTVKGLERHGQGVKNATQKLRYDELCSTTNEPFLVYVYTALLLPPSLINLPNSEVADSLVKDLQLGDSWTDDPGRACVFVVVVGPWAEAVTSEDVNNYISSLPHWETYSNRHVVIELSTSASKFTPFSQVTFKKALLAASYIPTNSLHHILIPPVLTVTNYHYVIPPTDSFVHETRTVKVYFEGNKINGKLESQVVKACNQFPKSICLPMCSHDIESGALDTEWSLCNTAADRLQKCQKALFALIPCGDEGDVGLASLTRLLEALQCGAVPVIIGTCANLPFSDVIDYGKAIVFASTELSDLTNLLQDAQNDFRKYQEHGLFLFNTYFSSALKIVETVIAVIRNHHNYPPMWYPDYNAEVLLNTMLRTSDSMHESTSYPSSMSVWSSPSGPLFATASPLSSVSDPNEKFTIVIITHHRERKLLRYIGTLKDCPNVDKVVVVWNNEKTYKKPNEYVWPNIGVPIEVVAGDGNSMNNRYLPFSNIKTEAVVQIDDDTCATKEDLEFGFRTWQKNRDSLVGWIGRTYKLNVESNGWTYSYGYNKRLSPCPYSMVVTPLLFHHKYYMYLYTYWMPESIRNMVTEQINCEDIAINFLLAHVTRKPPVILAGKEAAHCRGDSDPEGTSSKKNHIPIRGQCLQQFESALGYLPLLCFHGQRLKMP